MVEYKGWGATSLLPQEGVLPMDDTLLTGVDLFLDKPALCYMLFYKGNIMVEQPVPNVGKEAQVAPMSCYQKGSPTSGSAPCSPSSRRGAEGVTLSFTKAEGFSTDSATTSSSPATGRITPEQRGCPSLQSDLKHGRVNAGEETTRLFDELLPCPFCRQKHT